MKVALCISGFMRMCEETLDAFQRHLLEPYKPDVFISTWPDGDGRQPNTARIDEIYRPVAMEIEDWPRVLQSWGDIAWLEQRKRRDVTVPNVLGMFYKIWQANRMKLDAERARGFRYDAVVRMRTDLKLFETPNFSEVPAGYVAIGNSFGYGGLPDLFAYGNSASMDVYADVFPRIAQYVSEGCVLHPEMLLEWHVKRAMPQGVLFSSVPYRLLRPASAAGSVVWAIR